MMRQEFSARVKLAAYQRSLGVTDRKSHCEVKWDGKRFGIMIGLVAGVLAGASSNPAGTRYRECVALGAPPENCLKKYVLGEDEP